MRRARLITEPHKLYSINLYSKSLLKKVDAKILKLPDFNIMFDLVISINATPGIKSAADFMAMPVEYNLVCLIDDILDGMVWLTTAGMFNDLLYEDKIFAVEEAITDNLHFKPVRNWTAEKSLDSEISLSSPELPAIFLKEYNKLRLAQKAAFNYIWHNSDQSAILPLLVVQNKCTVDEFTDAMELVLTQDTGMKWDFDTKNEYQDHINDVINWLNRVI